MQIGIVFFSFAMFNLIPYPVFGIDLRHLLILVLHPCRVNKTNMHVGNLFYNL